MFVIGPATDGGYYLIGLCSSAPGLFTGIGWSTELVLQQTIERCNALHLTYVLLPELRDIDRMEDLEYYRRQGMTVMNAHHPRISVIIPPSMKQHPSALSYEISPRALYPKSSLSTMAQPMALLRLHDRQALALFMSCIAVMVLHALQGLPPQTTPTS